jgi:acetylcholinesterase
VWFYIQGGGYITNGNPNYNGTKVVEESGGKIIPVNFNYRVSAYGFLSSEKVRSNGNLNAGLLDQRKALEWVQKYISLVTDPDIVMYQF